MLGKSPYVLMYTWNYFNNHNKKTTAYYWATYIATFYWSTCTKPWKVTYHVHMCKGCQFDCFCDFFISILELFQQVVFLLFILLKYNSTFVAGFS